MALLKHRYLQQAFLQEHRDGFDENNYLEDLSDEQRQLCLYKALADFSQDIYRRRNRIAYLNTVAGEDFVRLPIDFVPDVNVNLCNLFYAPDANPTFFPTTSIDLWGSAIGASINPPPPIYSAFGTGYVTNLESLQPTSDDNGNWIFPLLVPEKAARQLTIRYTGRHIISDLYFSLSVVAQPVNGDEISIAATSYVFSDDQQPTDGQIPIGATLLDTLLNIADRLSLDQESISIKTTLVNNYLKLESLVYDTVPNMEGLTDKINIVLVPGVNTLPQRPSEAREWVHNLMNRQVYLCYGRLAAQTRASKKNGLYNSENWNAMAKEIWSEMKGYLIGIGGMV